MEKISELFEKIGKDRMIILIIAGILLLVISVPIEKKEVKDNKSEKVSKQKESDYSQNYKATMERELERILMQMDGAGKTKVFLYFVDDGYKQVEKDVLYEKNSEETEEENKIDMSNEETTVVTTNEAGESVPYVCRTQLPQIGGVLIVSQGGDNAQIQKEMKAAFMALFGLEEHKITIAKMKGDIS